MEHIRDVYHQSKAVLLKPIGIAVLVLLLSWYFALQYNLVGFAMRLLYAWSAIILIFAIRELVIWHLNAYYVTNKRLVKVSHDGLFKRTVIETPHERILNVSYKTTGVGSALFRFGDVEVQVVGLVEPIILKHIPHPAAIKDYIWELHRRVVTTQGVFEANDMAHVQERVGYTKKNQRIL